MGEESLSTGRSVALSMATIAALSVIQGLFGAAVVWWVASVLLAFCVGALWGGGAERKRARTRSPKAEG